MYQMRPNSKKKLLFVMQVTILHKGLTKHNILQTLLREYIVVYHLSIPGVTKK